MTKTNHELTFAGLKNALPIKIEDMISLRGKKFGLVIVDEVDGFCKVGAGNLAPPASDSEITKMVEESDRLAHDFVDRGMPVLVLRDCHEKGKHEPPYPPHCEEGTGEEELVEELKWLEMQALGGNEKVTIVNKDCINGFIGAITKDGKNEVVNWVNRNDIRAIVVVGICTDICVMQFVQSILSARNKGMMLSLKDVMVYVEACATYDLPLEVAKSVSLPETAAHPRDITNYMGLYFMQMSGAILAKYITVD